MANKYFNLVKKLLDMQKTTQTFETVTRKCRLLSAQEGKITVEFDVDESMTNHFGTMHGGCSAALTDELTSVALMATPKGISGVTTDLHVTYLGPAKLGETIQVDAEVVRNGKSLAFTKAFFYRQKDSAPVAVGSHTMAFAVKHVANKE